MYRPHTLYSDIGDVEILEHEGKLHVFHLVIPNRDLVAHCVSEDGLVWKELPPAIVSGAPGETDDDMIRTVSVTPHNGKFYMMYAGCSRRDGGRVERICMAVSEDLYTWEKLPENSSIESDPDIYESATDYDSYVNWRDPKPYYENGVYYCVICSRKREGATLRKGCAALMTSLDMVHWTVQQPLFLPGAYYAVECPQIYRIQNRYYLLGSIMEDNSQRYWVADHLEGPYYVAGGDNLLMPPHSHYAGRLTRFQGRDVYLCWTAAREDGLSPFGLRREPGMPIRYIPALLDVKTDDTGRLILKSIDAWKRFEKRLLPVNHEQLTHRLCDTPYAQSSQGVFSSPSGMEIWVAPECLRSFKLDCTLSIDGYCGGLAFHVDDDGAAYQLEFYPREHRAALTTHRKIRHPNGCEGFSYRVLQTTYCDTQSADVHISLIAAGGEIEISLNGNVRLATISTAALEGHWGVLANSGTVKLKKITLTEMAVPNIDQF